MGSKKQKAKKDKKTHVICFDYEKNLPLPLTNIQSEYYKRQLWIHNFCITDVGSGSATMFLYAEHYASKTPNEVLSCLDFYRRNYMPNSVEKLHIFCDNCAGQNKNRFNFMFFHLLAKAGIFKKIVMYFPVPGHSYMPCDQCFALIEKERRRKQRVLAPSEWVKMVRSAKKNDKFKVVFVQYPLTDDMHQDMTPICPVLDYKEIFEPVIVNKISGGVVPVRGFMFKGDKVFARASLLTKDYYEIDIQKNIDLDPRGVLAMPQNAYKNFLPVNEAKLKDVMSLLGQKNSIPFYEFIKGDKSVPEFCFEEDVL